MQTNNKMREALESVKSYLDGYTVNILDLRRRVDAALAEPVKNCEVGTADEQSRRFDDFCFVHISRERGCGDCPLLENTCCELAWGQMPYPESEVAK